MYYEQTSKIRWVQNSYLKNWLFILLIKQSLFPSTVFIVVKSLKLKKSWAVVWATEVTMALRCHFPFRIFLLPFIIIFTFLHLSLLPFTIVLLPFPIVLLSFTIFILLFRLFFTFLHRFFTSLDCFLLPFSIFFYFPSPFFVFLFGIFPTSVFLLPFSNFKLPFWNMLERNIKILCLV